MTTIEMRVRNMETDFSNSEKIVASYFLQNKENIFKYPLAVLAQMSGTSQGAWVRFCKSIGFEGLKGLKNALFLEMNQTIQESGPAQVQFTDIKDHATLSSMAENVCASSIQAIDATLKLFDEGLLELIVQQIIQADSVRLFGIGASSLVAADLYYKFLRIGYNVLYTQDSHIAITYASTGTPRDIGIFISNSGETAEILNACNILKQTGATAIAITRNCPNSLSQKADYVLYTSSPEVYKRSGAMSSRIAQLCINDILFTAVANRDYENIEQNLKLSYAACHPESAGGREFP